jgi:hypothetical protein
MGPSVGRKPRRFTTESRESHGGDHAWMGEAGRRVYFVFSVVNGL